MVKKKVIKKRSKKSIPDSIMHSTWEVTFRNYRKIVADVIKLEIRVEKLEAKMRGGPLPVFDTEKRKR